MRPVAIAFATCAMLLALSQVTLSRWAPAHFLPEQRMRGAVASGPGCIALFGDSRMDAAHAPAAFHDALNRYGADRCVVNLALGATDMSGVYLTLREYLARGGRPSLVVIGKVADSLMGPEQRLDPAQMVGNNAIHLTWSRAADVFVEVPGFPSANVAAFDAGLRFLSARATPAGRYQSLFSAKVQGLQNLLLGSRREKNRWGAVEDMKQLEGDLRARSNARLAAAMAGPSADRLGPWFPRVVSLLRDRSIPFTVVELPMNKAFRLGTSASLASVAYQRWVAQELPRLGGAFVDLSKESWLDESLFADALHLGPRGAALFSDALGLRLALGATLRDAKRR